MPPRDVGDKKDKHSSESCRIFVRLIKWFPVIFISSIVLWSYYAFVFQLCLWTVENPVEQIVYLAVYHVLFVMFVWSYAQTIFTRVAAIPEIFKLPEEELDRLAHAYNDEMHNSILEHFSKNLPTTNRGVTGTIRYCDKCKHIKPDRAHHCSVCRVCILKMDHHCPWVNNCVCFSNYKFFILFLLYALIYCIFISVISIQYIVVIWKGQRRLLDSDHTGSAEVFKIGSFHVLFAFFVSVMFAISLASLFCYHIYLVAVNRTTLEAFRAPIFIDGPDKHAFNIGRRKNFEQVFGNKAKLWFLPVFTTLGDGVTYPTRNHQPSYQTMRNSSTEILK